MVLFNMYGVFFRRFLESRNYKIQIVARVGRKSAVVLSGVTEASYPHFFIGRGFESRRALLENVRPGKCIPMRLQSPREWKNRTRLDEYHSFYCLIPPEDIIWKKNRWSLEQQHGSSSTPPKKVRKVGKSRSTNSD